MGPITGHFFKHGVFSFGLLHLCEAILSLPLSVIVTRDLEAFLSYRYDTDTDDFGHDRISYILALTHSGARTAEIVCDRSSPRVV